MKDCDNLLLTTKFNYLKIEINVANKNQQWKIVTLFYYSSFTTITN